MDAGVKKMEIEEPRQIELEASLESLKEAHDELWAESQKLYQLFQRIERERNRIKAARLPELRERERERERVCVCVCVLALNEMAESSRQLAQEIRGQAESILLEIKQLLKDLSAVNR